MAEAGDIIQHLEIKEISFGGDGVARLEEGAVVFIPFTAVGDVVTCQITQASKNFCRGDVRKIETAGAGRIEPQCPYFGRCGGCSYMHLDYETEIQAKKAQFASVISRIGHFSSFPELEKVFPSPSRLGYRNKLRLEPIQSRGNSQSLSYGFCEKDNLTFFPVKSCPLALNSINDEIKKSKFSTWGEHNTKRKKPLPLTLRADASGNCTSYFGFAPSKLSWLHENLLGKDVSVPVGSFWQINPPVAEELISTLTEWLRPLGARALIDAYAGVGTFSLALGELFQYRVVIESDKQAVEAAKYNHQKYGLKASFLAKSTENALDGVLARVKCAETVVLLDPPRTGCQPNVLKSLLNFGPETIAYVSCNPSTLARDLNILCNNDTSTRYVPVKAAIFDMFPCTAHFESVCLLSKQTS